MKNLILLSVSMLIGLSSFAQPVTCIDCTLIDPNAACPAIYDPVCGCNGVTYSNSCVAETTAGIVYYTGGECPPNNVSSCSDLTGVDFGDCDMVLGVALIDGECQTISGCSTTTSDSINYAGAIFPDMGFCQNSCLCGSTSNVHEELGLTEVSFTVDPDRSNLHVYFDLRDKALVSLYDLSGRSVVQEIVFSGDDIRITSLESGVYLIDLQVDGKSLYSERLLIKR